MNDAELIAKAREYLNSTMHLQPHPWLRPEMFTQARMAHAPMVIFGCNDREDEIEIILDPYSGECLSFTHVPQREKGKGG